MFNVAKQLLCVHGINWEIIKECELEELMLKLHSRNEWHHLSTRNSGNNDQLLAIAHLNTINPFRN